MDQETTRASLPTIFSPLRLWHGGRKWEGLPEIRPARRGRSEHGPGIYASTSIMTALKYAKGGGALYEMQIVPDVKWIQSVRVSEDAVMDWCRNTPRVRDRAALMHDIATCATNRYGSIDLESFLNLCINSDRGLGVLSRPLAEFIVANGAQASLVQRSGEDWVVIFDPAAIIKMRKKRQDEIDWSCPDFERIRMQTEAIANQGQQTNSYAETNHAVSF